MKTYQKIAQTINAMQNCIKSGNVEWQGRHEQTILDLVKDTAPSGSGVDCGTRIKLDESSDEKLVFIVEYHHMNDGGYYDGWTSHKVIVKPSLAFEFDMSITGRNKGEIKEYLHETYQCWLSQDVPEPVQAVA